MNERLERLRRDYIEGHIEVDEFERRLGPLLKGKPLPEDRDRPEDLRFGPGVAIPVAGDPRSVMPMITTRAEAEALFEAAKKMIESRGLYQP